MAGFFPDAPAPRMAIDVDGAQGFWINNQAVVTQLTPADMATINNESDDRVQRAVGLGGSFAIIFPELRQIAAAHLAVSFAAGVPVVDFQASSDTTSGLDGTWHTIRSFNASSNVPAGAISPGYRLPNAEGLPVTARGVRLLYTTGSVAPAMQVYQCHLYGTIAPGEAAHRLAFWHPTLDEPMPAAWLDWGDIRQDTLGEQHFRVKNLSPSSAASDITLAMSALSVTDSLAMHRFSIGAGDQVSTLPIGNLAPGAISPVITLHRDMADAVLGLRALRLHAAATAWE